MPRKKSALTLVPESLYRDIRAVLESARSSAYRAVNTAMVQAYWQVGRLIVEHEQGGRNAQPTARRCWTSCRNGSPPTSAEGSPQRT